MIWRIGIRYHEWNVQNDSCAVYWVQIILPVTILNTDELFTVKQMNFNPFLSRSLQRMPSRTVISPCLPVSTTAPIHPAGETLPWIPSSFQVTLSYPRFPLAFTCPLSPPPYSMSNLWNVGRLTTDWGTHGMWRAAAKCTGDDHQIHIHCPNRHDSAGQCRWFWNAATIHCNQNE